MNSDRGHADKAGLESLARGLPVQESATAPVNDYATPKVNLAGGDADEAVEHVAKKFFNQIQGADDGSLVVDCKT